MIGGSLSCSRLFPVFLLEWGPSVSTKVNQTRFYPPPQNAQYSQTFSNVLQWASLKTSGAPPPPVEKAATVVVGNRLFLLGGDCGDISEDETGVQVMQGLFELDLEVRFRLLVPVTGSACWFRLLVPLTGSAYWFRLLVRQFF